LITPIPTESYARRILLQLEGALNKIFGNDLNPFYYLGALGFYFFWVVVVSGAYIYAFYKTGIELSYPSVEYLTHEQWYLGGVMRSLHRYASDALVVVLDGMTDPQNFGACARSAEAAGAELLLARHRRAAPFTAAAVRASAGALLHLPVARVHNLVRALESLQDRGFTTVGLDQRAQATIHDAAPGRPLALVVGAVAVNAKAGSSSRIEPVAEPSATGAE